MHLNLNEHINEHVNEHVNETDVERENNKENLDTKLKFITYLKKQIIIKRFLKHLNKF